VAADERRVCLRATAALGALFVLLLTLVVSRWGPLWSLDRGVDSDLHALAVAHSGWTHANRVLTDWVWDPLTMRGLLGLAALWALWRHELWTATWLVVCGVVGGVLEQGTKSAVGRHRPRWPHPVDSAHYASFPSGHAMTAAIVCGALLWLFIRRTSAGARWRGSAWALAAVSVVGVGFTRVYLGVHWPSDVLGGWLLGGIVVAGAAAVFSPWLEESRV
jgi:undecaprenyl-diphosphatase